MNDVKTWRALCSHWNTSPYDLECGLRAACDRIEALERENAALRSAATGLVDFHVKEEIGAKGWPECLRLVRDLEAALAPATSKETP